MKKQKEVERDALASAHAHWAAKPDGITGNELLAFINNEEATLPDGKKGAGLAEQRRVVARIEELAAQIHEAHTLRHQATDEAEALAGSNASGLFLKCSERQPIGALAEVRGGIQKGPHRAPGANPVRYLTVAHVHRNKILTDSPRYFEVSPEELERWRLLRGDVLITEGNGSADQIGRTALFRGEIENCVHQNHVIRIRPNNQRVLSEFLNTFLNSPAGQDAVQGQSRTRSGLRSLSIGASNPFAFLSHRSLSSAGSCPSWTRCKRRWTR